MLVEVEYDLEVEGEVLSMEEAGVQNTIEVPNDIHEDDISDWITDQTGWCVFKWKLKGEPLRLYKIISVETTKNYYGLGSGMKDLIGKLVRLPPPTKSRRSFRYQGFSWHYGDVIEVDDTPIERKVELFDPTNLMGASDERGT